MKLSAMLPLVTACAITAGCASNPFSKKEPTPQAMPNPVQTIPSPTPAVTEPIKLAAQGKVNAPLVIDVPPWYIKAPDSTDEYVFITGTGISSSLSMSRAKALLDAQYQLASKINGEIDAVMRQSRKDNEGKLTTDYTSLSIRKRIVDTSIAGHHLEDSRIQAENKGYRTFVLVRYPVSQMTSFLNMKNKQASPEDSDKAVDKDVGKVSVPNAATTPETAQVTQIKEKAAVPVNDLQLLDVDNEEYKRRRAEALQKPGAIVGRTTLR